MQELCVMKIDVRNLPLLKQYTVALQEVTAQRLILPLEKLFQFIVQYEWQSGLAPFQCREEKLQKKNCKQKRASDYHRRNDFRRYILCRCVGVLLATSLKYR